MRNVSQVTLTTCSTRGRQELTRCRLHYFRHISISGVSATLAIYTKEILANFDVDIAICYRLMTTLLLLLHVTL